MNTKRLMALLAALLMIVALFSACGEKDASKANDGANDAAKTDEKTDDKTEDKSDDTSAPDEADIAKITWMSRGTADNYLAALDGGYANLAKCYENQHQYGFEVDTTFVASEVYSSTVNSLAASNSLPEVFSTYGVLDTSTIVEWTNRGMFLSCSEVMNYSTGNMIKAFGEDGLYKFAVAKSIHTDGDWYMVMSTNDPARNLQITEEDGPLRAKVQLHGIYGLLIRKDWLDKLGMDMPQNEEEYYEACLAFHDGDVNENGLNDERVILGLGTMYQNQGIGQWYGLPYLDFFSDPSNGQVEVAMLKPGFADWTQYMARMYDHQLVYNNEGGYMWEKQADYISENNVISWYCQTNTIWSSGRTNSGDDNCNYQPLPIIAAFEGEKARIICQEATAAEFAWSYRADFDPALAAAFVDCVYSYEQFILRYYGLEGLSFEYEEDGVHIDDYTKHEGYKKEDIENGNKAVGGMDSSFAGFLSWFPMPFFQDLWDPMAHTYTSAQEAMDAGEPYAEGMMTAEIWMKNNEVDYDQPNRVQVCNLAAYGEENINVAAYYDYECLPTVEEQEVLLMYATDLKTYVQEVGTKIIMGDYDVSKLQEYIDFAYENLGLQEYIDAQQARVDRFMVAMGLY